MSEHYDFFASCPKGVEGLLAEELAALGGEEIRQTVAGCHFKGELLVAYRCCLWSRLANRILLHLRQIDAESRDFLYDGVKAIPWEDHFEQDATLAITFNGTSKAINNSHFGALVVKDAVCDRLRDKADFRPSINKTSPDIRVHVRMQRNRADISLDLSGESLHRRGYRLDTGKAPLKENLAAALLMRAGWPQMAKEGAALVDPLCGSGTLLLEGALMAADIAPGLLRLNYGFHNWSGHIPKLWRELLEDARERRTKGLAALNNSFIGYEGDVRVVRQAHDNLRRAGLEKRIHIETRELANVEPIKGYQGLVISNPPYGERLGEESSLVWLYQRLGETFRHCFEGWQGAIVTSNPNLAKRMGLRARKNYSFYNGALEARLLTFDIQPASYFGYHKKTQEADSSGKPQTAESSTQISLGKGAEMFANRLRKNLKPIQKWARKNDIECYRVYDADMPEYAVAIDLYGDQVLVQEYKAPASVDEQKAEQRLHDVLQAIPTVLPVKTEQIALKQRRRQSGKNQYRKLADQQQRFEVTEGGCRFLVNLKDYLDTGLFLDHRPMRLRIQKEAAGKRFLNLFCYTGAATVHAAAGGASMTTSVDLSKTYLEWTRQNLSLNGFSDKHKLENADCIKWLKECKDTYDLIFIDPPTFSNSKKMRDVFDIQVEHRAMLEKAMGRLARDGVLYFSNNFRKFQLDADLSEKFSVEEISAQTIDQDFKRNQKIHRCWKLTHRH